MTCVGVDVDAEQGRPPSRRARARSSSRASTTSSRRPSSAGTAARDHRRRARRSSGPTSRWSASARRRRRTAAPTSPTSRGPWTTSREAMADVAPPASGFHAVVIRSTVPPGTGRRCRRARVRRSRCPPAGRVGTAMCPEFLREGSGVADFFDPPFVVIGTADDRARQRGLRAAVRVPRPARSGIVDVAQRRGAEVRLQRLPRRRRSRSPTRWPGSSAQLRRRLARASWRSSARTRSSTSRRPTCGPGFAFGGSCLPKDLRALLHMARMNASTCRCSPARSLTQRARRRATSSTGCSPAGVPARRPARAQLQDGHRRPAGEPERRARRAADRQGLRGPHLRPDRQPGAARRRQPALRARASCPTCGGCSSPTPEEALEGADVALVRRPSDPRS